MILQKLLLTILVNDEFIMTINDMFEHDILLLFDTMLNNALDYTTSISMRGQSFSIGCNVIDNELHLTQKTCCNGIVAVTHGNLRKGTQDLDGTLDDVIAIRVMGERKDLIVELGNEFAYLFFFEASDGLLDYSAAVLHLVRSGHNQM